MEQMIMDKAKTGRRILAIGQRLETIVKEKEKKPSVLKKLDEYKQM